MRDLMRRAAVVAGAAVVLLGPAVGVASAAGGAGGGTRPAAGDRAVFGAAWGRAREVPGTARLNQGGDASVTSVSCPSAGNCSAGGSYALTSQCGYECSPIQAFVVSEVNGTWGKARQVPGTARLNVDGGASVTSVSCPSAGNCSAGGYYNEGVGRFQAFVVSEVNGTWGKARQVPGTAPLNLEWSATVNSVSCASAGNCGAGGFFTVKSNSNLTAQAYVLGEVNGTWGKAREVPGIARLNQDGYAQVTSVSCTSAGNCSAGGSYTDSSDNQQAFVVSEVNGTWGKAREVPGTARLNQGRYASVSSVSCASAGNCSAGGPYTNSSGYGQAFVVSQANGTWGKAEEVPGTAALSQGGGAGQTGTHVASVACASAGNCSADGVYIDSSGHTQAFVVSEVNGTWGEAREVPGTARLNQGGDASVSTVACASAGNCSAGGGYRDRSNNGQAFVVSEVNGTWGEAREVPGTARLNQGGDASVSTVACAPEGTCSAGGGYLDNSGFQAFVVNKG